MMDISEKLYRLRTENDLTQVEFGKIAGVTDKAVSTWERGEKEPRMKYIRMVCNHFGIDINKFVDPQTDVYKAEPTNTLYTPANIIPVPRTTQIPLIGTIACGTPLLAEQNLEGAVDLPEQIRADFALRCKGDSMITARIFDGDIVYIHQCSEVANGKIAAVRVGDEATLKRVYYFPDDARLVLRPCNPMYSDMIYTGPELEDIEIIGEAVAFTSLVRHE